MKVLGKIRLWSATVFRDGYAFKKTDKYAMKASGMIELWSATVLRDGYRPPIHGHVRDGSFWQIELWSATVLQDGYTSKIIDIFLCDNNSVMEALVKIYLWSAAVYAVIRIIL